MPHNAKLSPQEIETHLDNLSRAPFRAVLADVLGAAPTKEQMVDFAIRNPDRWGQLLAIVSKLGGYTEKLEVESTLTQRVESMSDAAIEARLAELERQSKERKEE